MSNPSSARRTQRSHPLQVVEYASTAVSVVGVVVSALSQQVAYAAAPLSLSLCLNLVNRRRFEQQTEQRFNGAIAQLDQRLLHLDPRVLEQSAQSLTERVADLSEQLTAFGQSQNETAIDLRELRSQLAHLQERFTTTQQGQNATATNLGELQARLSQLNAQLIAIQQRQADAVTGQAGLDAQFSQVRDNLSQEIQEIRQQLQRLDGLEALQQAFPRLAEQIAFLEQRQSPTATDHDELLARLSQLDTQLAAIEQRQADIATSQTGLNAQSQVRENLSQEIEEIRQQLQAITLNFGEFQALQQAFPRLADQIAQLQEQLRTIATRQTSEPADPPAPEVEEISELEDLVLNLGIDFGTSFTKVCFRDESADRSEIVTFTDEITHLEEALLPTKIGILPDGTLIAGLTASEWQPYENQVQTMVEFIKMRLADLEPSQRNESWRLEELFELDNPETVENLCAYYLSRVITRTQAWIRHNKPELIINRKIGWSANVGVPVEYCDSPAIKRFEKVLSLAWLLSNKPQTERMTMQNLRDCMRPLRITLEETLIDCHAIPEIAAEAWSLIKSLEIDGGLYALFDVGDGTLDGSSFQYRNEDGEKKVDFFFGKVDPLGVTAFCQQSAKELDVLDTDIKDTLRGNSTRYSVQLGSSKTRREIQKLIAKVILQGCRRYVEHGGTLMKRGFEKPLNILMGGGGGQSIFYTQVIKDTYSDFQHQNAGIPEYEVRSLPTPKDLETNGISNREFHRFAVAYGLSIPTGEQPEVRLPSEMEKVKLAPPRGEDPMGKTPKANEPR